MKKIAAVALIVFLSGCKKTIENVKEDLVIKAMTDGQWKVTTFTVNSTNVTADFTNYRFKYYSDKTVDAINTGVVEKNGTWDGDASTMTTWAQFNGAAHPLSLINGSWHIDRNSWTFVEASQTTSGGEVKTMRLDKE